MNEHLHISLHRKRSIDNASVRREESHVRKLKHQVVKDIEDLARLIQTASGPIIHFIERQRSDLIKSRSLANDVNAIAQIVKILQVHALQDKAGFNYCGARVFQESLRDSMVRTMTPFMRRTGQWPSKPGGLLMRERALGIATLSRDTSRMKAEVAQFLDRVKEATVRMPKTRENHWDKQMRIHEFWETFHGRSRDNWRPLVRGIPDHCDPEDAPSVPVACFFSQTAHPGGAAAPSPWVRPSEAGVSRGLASSLGRPGPPRLAPAGQPALLSATAPAGALAPRRSRLGTPPTTGDRASFAPDQDRKSFGFAKPSVARPPDRKSLAKRPIVAAKAPPSLGQSFAQWSTGLLKSPSEPGLLKSPSEPSVLGSSCWLERSRHAVPVLPPLAFGRHRYLTDCDTRGNVPVPLRCITGHSKTVAAAGQDLVDSDLLALAGAMQEMEAVEEVDLSGNGMLKDASLGPFLQQLCMEPLSKNLRKLILANCTKMGAAAVSSIVKLVDSASMLLHLDLSHVAVPTKLQMPLCTAIGYHPRLRTVSLAEAGFREKSVCAQCMAALLDSGSVSTLDLSWNCFDDGVFNRLGERLVLNSTLRSLRLQNCSSSVRGVDPPVASLFEHLAKDRSLRYLDVSMNHIDFRTALVIEDCLDGQPKLEEICLAHNPLGVPGIRSVLRLLSRPSSGLRRFDIDACYRGDVVPDVKAWQEGHKSFNPTEPNGRYVLDLSGPGHRSMLRMVYKTLSRLGVAPEAAFSGVSYQLKGGRSAKWSHPERFESVGLLHVPMEGAVTFNLKIEPALELMNKGFQESDLSGVVDRYYDSVRARFGWIHSAAVFACWSGLDGQFTDQDAFLNAMSKDFSLTVANIDFMCNICQDCTSEIISRLFQCLPTTEANQFFCHMLLATLGDILQTERQMSAIVDFNAANPSGTYKLDLDNCSAHAVAERLRLLDRWERIVDSRHGRIDVSQRHNRSHFRNESFQGRSLWPRFPSVADWPLPEASRLEVDYVTTQRPAPDAECVDEELWAQLLTCLMESPCHPENKLKVLRSISHYIWMTCFHVRQLIGCFRNPGHRVDLIVMFFSRIVDMYNEKVFRVRLSPDEIRRVNERLGYATMFPYLQPEHCRFALDMAYPDQRLVCSFLVRLEEKEKPGNIQEYEMHYVNGQVDRLEMGIPRSWADMDSLPTEGVFHCFYNCAPDDRRFEYRRKFAETATFFTMNVADSSVSWWASLKEAPVDVLELLSWLVGKFPNMNKVFRALTGSSDPDKTFNLRQLEDFLAQQGCRKFDGPDEKSRILGVFRYLDPGREGTVSKHEFMAMNKLWKEMDLCIREFTFFVCHVFGEDFEELWLALDQDSSGTLTLEEWLNACEHVGYFGPADIVFKFIDSDDDGVIQFDELGVLEATMNSVGKRKSRTSFGPSQDMTRPSQVFGLARPVSPQSPENMNPRRRTVTAPI